MVIPEKSLKKLELDSLVIAMESDDENSLLSHQESVSRGENLLPLDVYRQFHENGTRLIHGGVPGTYLKNNFLHVEDIYAAIDTDNSYLAGCMNLDERTIEWQIFAASTDNVIHYGWSWRFESTPFSTHCKLPDLAGFKKVVADPWNDPTAVFYDGVYQRIEQSDLEILRIDNNRAHIRWTCELEFGRTFELDAELPVRGISIRLQPNGT